jgi:hypothetical protein
MMIGTSFFTRQEPFTVDAVEGAPHKNPVVRSHITN